MCILLNIFICLEGSKITEYLKKTQVICFNPHSLESLFVIIYLLVISGLILADVFIGTHYQYSS
jgi:hypothetical protein